MKALILGSTGGIGQATARLLKDEGHDVVEVTRCDVNFTSFDSDRKIKHLLKVHHPDVVINSAGYLATNSESADGTLAVNVISNWSIVHHYLDRPPSKPVKIIFVGSSAYREGKKQYMMYSASKAALHNLWEGAVDFFKNSNVTASIIHPVRTRTKMTINRFSPELDYFEPEAVAQEILKLVNDDVSKCVNLSFNDLKEKQ